MKVAILASRKYCNIIVVNELLKVEFNVGLCAYVTDE